MDKQNTEAKAPQGREASAVGALVSWPDWVPLTKQQPKDLEPVLLLFETGARRIGNFLNGRFYSYGYKQDWKAKPTHWLPLPPGEAS